MRCWAWGVLCLAGCGGGHEGHAPTVDAPAANLADAAIDVVWPVGNIHVRVIDMPTSAGGESGPVAGDAIVFTDVNQTQVVMTDGNGDANATVTGPTTITRVHHWPEVVTEAWTVLAAQPGDDILLERHGRDFTALAPIQLSLAQQSYQVCTPCSCTNGSSTTAVPIYRYCAAATVPVVALTGQGYANADVAYDPTTGGSVTLSQLTPGPQYTGTLTNIPAAVTQLRFGFVAGAEMYQTVSSPATSASLQVTGWRGLPARFVTRLDNSAGADQTLQADVSAASTGYSADVGGALLPWLGQTSFDLGTQTLKVPMPSPGAPFDMFLGSVTYTAAGGKFVYWSVFGATPGDVPVPHVPASVADMTAIDYGSTAAILVESDAVTGFDEARRDPVGVWHRFGTAGAGTVTASRSPGAIYATTP